TIAAQNATLRALRADVEALASGDGPTGGSIVSSRGPMQSTSDVYAATPLDVSISAIPTQAPNGAGRPAPTMSIKSGSRTRRVAGAVAKRAPQERGVVEVRSALEAPAPVSGTTDSRLPAKALEDRLWGGFSASACADLARLLKDESAPRSEQSS